MIQSLSKKERDRLRKIEAETERKQQIQKTKERCSENERVRDRKLPKTEVLPSEVCSRAMKIQNNNEVYCREEQAKRGRALRKKIVRLKFAKDGNFVHISTPSHASFLEYSARHNQTRCAVEYYTSTGFLGEFRFHRNKYVHSNVLYSSVY